MWSWCHRKLCTTSEWKEACHIYLPIWLQSVRGDMFCAYMSTPVWRRYVIWGVICGLRFVWSAKIVGTTLSLDPYNTGSTNHRLGAQGCRGGRVTTHSQVTLEIGSILKWKPDLGNNFSVIKSSSYLITHNLESLAVVPAYFFDTEQILCQHEKNMMTSRLESKYWKYSHSVKRKGKFRDSGGCHGFNLSASLNLKVGSHISEYNTELNDHLHPIMRNACLDKAALLFSIVLPQGLQSDENHTC